MKKPTIAFLFLAISALVFAKGNFQVGTMPSIILRKSFPKNWSATFQLESRQSVFRQELDLDYLLTDIRLALSKRIAYNITVGAGYLIRIEEEAVKHRTLQQINFGKRFPGFRMTHRLMTEQTFGIEELTEYSLRYRLAVEIPLQGQSIDAKEFFVRLNNEYVNSLQGGDYDLEIRSGGLLGYSISRRSDFEIGFDNRIDNFVGGILRNRLWLRINFFHSLDRL